LGDLILQSSLENRISSLMYKEGLYNKLDNLLRNLNLQYKIHSRNWG
jgi:hypothetical protein